MKFFTVRFGLAQSLVAITITFALVLSSNILAFASLSRAESNVVGAQTDSSQNELQLRSATATATAAGVLLQWRTNSVPDNVGFHIYRLKDGLRTRVNREIIPGALFAPGTPALMRAGYSYSWFDRGGTANSTYFIESVNVEGSSKSHEPLRPVISRTASEFDQAPAAPSGSSAAEGTDISGKMYPAAQSQQPNVPNGPIEEQWAIAAQTGLKIGIKKDGWYRVTQQQMVAAGFNPTVDIRNLRLFVDANEVAILTNQLIGAFGSGDYIEFYGRGLDIPTTDTRIYYLLAGTGPGMRVLGDIQLDSPPIDPPPPPTSTPPVAATPPPPGPTSTPPVVATPPSVLPVLPVTTTTTQPVLRDPIFYSSRTNFSWLLSTEQANQIIEAQSQRVPLDPPAIVNSNSQQATPDYSNPSDMSVVTSDSPSEKPAPAQTFEAGRQSVPVVNGAAVSALGKASKVETPSPRRVLTRAASKSRKRAFSKKRKRSKMRRQLQPERHHALIGDGFAASNFNHTIQIKNRGVYLSNLLNGDEENWFGNVISSPVTINLIASNADLSAAGPATLEFALQGVSSQFGNPHQVVVTFNGTTIDTLNFAALEHPVRSIPIPIALLQSGANTLKFTKTSTGEVSIVDYVRFTYPHVFKADSDSLKFNVLDTQTLKVDGFSIPSIRLIDYTDSFTVSITKPASEPTAFGYAITVPRSETRTKSQRLFYAFPDGHFLQPASLLLNQPSTLNLSSNTGDFLIISHQTFMPTFTSLVAQRQGQGFTVSIAAIEDIYDEFSYGVHGPQAIRSFLQHASTNWTTPRPRYVIFAGDSSLDPRNYQGSGNFDFVPTKLVDATFSETSADDWLTDFDDDGVANIPVGRLPFRTVADANLLLARIVNFTPVTPQSAMLVADDPTNYYFNFEIANDQVEALLIGSMTVQRVNVRTEGSAAQAKATVIAGFNQGRALVNYTGHGNVDVWTSAGVFTSNDALALTNGNQNKFSFVVVMDCLNGYFQDPVLLSLSEALLKAPNGGAVAAFASSGLTFPDGQHEMAEQLYTSLYGAQPIALGDAIKIAKNATFDIDVRRTWIFFGDPSMKIR